MPRRAASCPVRRAKSPTVMRTSTERSMTFTYVSMGSLSDGPSSSMSPKTAIALLLCLEYPQGRVRLHSQMKDLHCKCHQSE